MWGCCWDLAEDLVSWVGLSQSLVVLIGGSWLLMAHWPRATGPAQPCHTHSPRELLALHLLAACPWPHRVLVGCPGPSVLVLRGFTCLLPSVIYSFICSRVFLSTFTVLGILG